MWLIEQKHSPNQPQAKPAQDNKKTRNPRQEWSGSGSTFAVSVSSVSARLQSVFSFYPVSEGLNNEKQEFAHEMVVACPRDNVSGLDGSGGAGICR